MEQEGGTAGMSKPFCPMCGEPVKVVGKTTFHYESVANEEITRLRSALEKYGCHLDDCEAAHLHTSEYGIFKVRSATGCDCKPCNCGLSTALQGGSDGS